MTVRALLGLVLLNAFLLGVGAALLLGLRGFRAWAELARLSGLAYMVGVAGLGVALTLELTAGIPFSAATALATGAALAGAGLVLARLLRRPWPARLGGGIAVGPVVAVGAALVAVYLEALFRAGRLNALSAWDAWAFWVPKAEAIYAYGGLDEQLFRELPGATYPPLLPALEATAFHFMGSADLVTLHVQFWFLLVGFLAALVGLLAPRVPALLLWPFLLLVLAAPRVVLRTLDPQADFLLDYLFVAAALLVALWLLDQEGWQIAAASLLLAAAMLTKREGQLFAACVLASALAVSFRERRRAWPRLALAAAAAGGLAVPWRIWFTSRGLEGEFPQIGILGLLDHLDRALPAFQSVLSTATDYRLWLIVLPLAWAAVAVAALAGSRLLAAYAGLLYALMIGGMTWVLWSFPEFRLPFVQDESVNPIVRLTASLALLSAGLSPLLLDAAWRGGRSLPAAPAPLPSAPARRRWRWSAPAVVAAAALGYPLAVLAGGLPRFPSGADCARPASPDRPIEAVFGSFASERQAPRLRDRALERGFQGIVAERNACGRVEVAVRGVPSLAVGRELAEEARARGFRVALEAGG